MTLLYICEVGPSAVRKARELNQDQVWPDQKTAEVAMHYWMRSGMLRYEVALGVDNRMIGICHEGIAPPLRAPHYSVQEGQMFNPVAPHGEAYLAIGGTLLLDEAMELQPQVLRRLSVFLRDGVDGVQIQALVLGIDPEDYTRRSRQRQKGLIHGVEAVCSIVERPEWY